MARKGFEASVRDISHSFQEQHIKVVELKLKRCTCTCMNIIINKLCLWNTKSPEDVIRGHKLKMAFMGGKRASLS